jgi:hypothetical protein
MAFTEKVKDEIRKKAHYQCCICKEFFIDIHHIIPQEEKGTDTIDNAAPLCQNCHRQYGNNPDHRKTIRGMRDLWYEICETRYKDNYSQPIYEKLDSLGQEMNDLKNDKVRQSALLNEIKNLLVDLQSKEQKAIKNSSSIADIQSKNITATKLGDRVYSNVHCKKCNTSIGLSIGSDRCPTCGELY